MVKSAQNTARSPEAATATEGQTVTAPTPAAGSTEGQRAALRQDTKINARTTAAAAKITEAPKGAKLEIKGLALAQEGSIRSQAKGSMFVAPGAYLASLGNTDPSSKAPQAILAVEVAKKLGATKDVGVDLHHLQHEYVRAGGTDLSIFTGRTRLLVNGGKCSMGTVDGKKVPMAPLAVYIPPAQKQEAIVQAVESKEVAETAADAAKK